MLEKKTKLSEQKVVVHDDVGVACKHFCQQTHLEEDRVLKGHHYSVP
jgi:hypothetical protein